MCKLLFFSLRLSKGFLHALTLDRNDILDDSLRTGLFRSESVGDPSTALGMTYRYDAS